MFPTEYTLDSMTKWAEGKRRGKDTPHTIMKRFWSSYTNIVYNAL